MLGTVERYKGTYLENIVESLKLLPNDMARSSSLIHRLDLRSAELQRIIELQQEEVLSQAKSGRTMPDLELLQRLRSAQEEAHCINQEKVELAIQAEDLIRSFVDRLEYDVKEFEEELGDDVPPDPFAQLAKPRRSVSELIERNPPPRPPRPDDDLYCYCQQISHGEMVGCEGSNCPYEWFHTKCVDMDRIPSSDWFCEDCQREAG